MTALPSSSNHPPGSKEATPERSLAQPPRYKSACESCHSSKVKCTGKQPCARCANNGWECVYKLASRIGKPKGSRNKSTLRRLQLEAEQAERELAHKSGSTTSTGSSPMPPTPITAGTVLTRAGLGINEEHKTVSGTGSNFAGWSWTPEAELWIPTTDGEVPLQPALSVANQSSINSTASQFFALEESAVVYGGLATSIESIPGSTSSHPQSGVSSARGASERDQFADTLSYLGTDDAYDYPQWSPSIAVDSVSAGASSPAGAWLSPDGPSGFDYSDPHWTVEPCPCNRNLVWQLSRIDQLRQALTINTSLRAFMYEANEAIQSIRSFLGCQVCSKDSTSLSIMVTMFTNISHLFVTTLNRTMDPLALYIRVRNYALGTVDPERLAAEKAFVRELLRRWLRTCDNAQRVVQGLLDRPPAAGESAAADSKKAKPAEATGLALWGPPELGSYAEMLWRVKQNLSTYA